MIQYLRKLFDVSDREIKAILPIVEKINALEPAMGELSDAELRAKTDEFKERLKAGETLDDLLPEAFAVVREVSWRTLGMRQFDVQLIGGVVLHHGNIAEMKTGEGKTLVAVAPLYLNALTGRGCHLVTVNDYLARRDAVWMGPIYHSLGLTVGVIQGQSAETDELGGSYRYEPGADVLGDPRYLNLVPCSRREAYLCDVVYGTNHEFGFDYLRDNMAFSVEQLSMRELHYAIVDEVDSILIDEARTPHIISGPSNEDVSIYKEVDAVVRQLQPEVHYTVNKKDHQASLTEEGMDLVEQLLGIDNIANDPKLFHHVNASVKAYALFDRDVEYVVRNGEVVLVDENTGRLMFGRRLSDGIHQALEAKEGVPIQRESQTVAVITFQNLFRLYEKLAGMTGTAKTEEDEFRKIYGLEVVGIPTHRPMIRVDHEDVVYKTLEAKFRGIAREILRLFTKQQPVLVGTRSIEMSEKVSARLNPEMLQKLLLVDRLYEAREERKDLGKDVKAMLKEIVESPLAELKMSRIAEGLRACGYATSALDKESMDWFLNKHGLPAENVGYLDEALRHGIPHNVLNAKFHEKEALIIAEAGRKGAVTIATNMAGRGVDILLGGRVSDAIVEKERAGEEPHEEHVYMDEFASTFASYRRGGKERAAPPLPLSEQERQGLADEVRKLGGLYILGTERHESRRIDNQLRGRAGRQGDPGESRFFVSLEDQLWKIFNARMLENPALKLWPPMEEVRQKFISKMIAKTQERIENHFFEARKHILEYDDVLNVQREHIYGMRREILLGKDCRPELQKGLREVIEEIVRSGFEFDEVGNRSFDHEGVYERLNEIFPLVDEATPSEFTSWDPEQVAELAYQKALALYEKKAEELGEDMKELERWVMLKAVNDRWMDHLQMIDYIREGIGLRGYGQVDPLVAYKKETYDLFQNTLRAIRNQAVTDVFRLRVVRERPAPIQMMKLDEAEVAAMSNPGASGAAPAGAATATAVSGGAVATAPVDVDWRKVSRNDPCPCGSGKKFKNCHYPLLRQQGVI